MAHTLINSNHIPKQTKDAGLGIDMYSNQDYPSVVSGNSCLSFNGVHTDSLDLSDCVNGGGEIQKPSRQPSKAIAALTDQALFIRRVTPHPD
jgi:hypothetical protein